MAATANAPRTRSTAPTAAASRRRARATARSSPRTSAPGAQSGRSNSSPSRICSINCACASTPGVDGLSGVATTSDSSDALAPTTTILPARSARSTPGSNSFHAGRRKAGIGRGEIGADVAGGLRRHDQVADLDRRDAGALPERRTAGIGRFDQVGRGALRDPQALDGEARLNLAVDDDQQRHAAHHPVGVRLPVDEADSRGALGENCQRPERAVEMRQVGLGVLADEGEAALGGDGAGELGLGDELAQNDGSTDERTGESRVAFAARRAVRFGAGRRRRGRNVGRRAIRLRKQHVEADRRNLGAGEGFDQSRHLSPRPRPLAQPPDRLVVDVDDADESLGPLRARPPALVLIEDDVLEIGAQRRQRLAERERAGVDGDDDQQIAPVPLETPRRGFAPGAVHAGRAASAEQRARRRALGPFAGKAAKPPIPRWRPLAIRRGASDQAPSSVAARARASFNGRGLDVSGGGGGGDDGGDGQDRYRDHRRHRRCSRRRSAGA